ncbi:putative oxygen-independent coproporphyrinogen III oxidase [Oribacterium sp. oral taxon 108 str. F0425]|nr:putative oxygen-independent coproporphyrinogen III oxidase [Oribacterium sp. oral taxon 108 str. F0425]
MPKKILYGKVGKNEEDFPMDKFKRLTDSLEKRGKKPLALYIHIPFCARKCGYCDFLSFPSTEEKMRSYMEQLRRELLFRAGKPGADCSDDTEYLLHSQYEIVSIFFGGGTPSIVPFSEIEKTMEMVRKHYPLTENPEITIECNPSSTMKLALLSYKRAGINRISFGLQSTNDEELEFLGRTHRYNDFLRAYQDARLSGFDNISIDLINGIPLQTVESYTRTLKNIHMLRPEHLSVYNLIVEPGTRFYHLQKEGKLPLPSEDELVNMDKLTLEWTAKMGMERYEISNFAKPDYFSLHNFNYWSDVPYLGFGIGASSYFQKSRWQNCNNVRKYMDIPFPMEEDRRLNITQTANTSTGMCKETASSPEKQNQIEKELTTDRHALSKKEQMEEFFFLGLRRTEGITEMDFVARFSVDMHQLYGEVLSQLVKEGYLIHQNSRYYFTEEGLDLSNQLLARFL